MSATDDGLYKASFTSAYKSESIILITAKKRTRARSSIQRQADFL